MPLPTPRSGEKKQDFISRCIETLTKEERDQFPSQAQRAAVCYSQWGETPEEKETAQDTKENREKKREKEHA